MIARTYSDGSPLSVADEAARAATVAPATAVTGERAETYCETCAHPVNVRRGGFCIAAGHVVSVIQITVHTFNAPHPRPFVAQPAPYLGSSR